MFQRAFKNSFFGNKMLRSYFTSVVLSACPLALSIKYTVNKPKFDHHEIPSSLHSKAAEGTAFEIEEYISTCGLDLFDKMLKETTCHGNTPLHLAAKYNKSDVVRKLTQNLNSQTSETARQINDEGALPIYLVNQNVNAIESAREYRKMIEALKAPTFMHTLVDINQPLDIDKILSTYANVPKNSLVFTHLKLSALAINKTRSLLRKSNTHPITNALPAYQRQKIEDEIRKMREDIELEYSYGQGRFWANESKYLHQIYIKHSIQKGMGNCYEYSLVTLNILKELNINSVSEMYALKHGKKSKSHVFIVVGRDKKSNASDYLTWGENAVVCDSWSGEVFLSSEIPSRLQYWAVASQDNHVLGNICGPLNKKIHSLTPF